MHKPTDMEDAPVDRAAEKRRLKEIKQASNEGVIGRLDRIDKAGAGAKRKTWHREGMKHAWYIPTINAYPTDQELFDTDIATVIRDYVLPGHAPTAPILDQSATVVTLGSCFARELRVFLSMSGVSASRFWIPSGLNNTFAILDFFSWCINGQETGRGYRYERGADGGIGEWTPEAERDAYLDAFTRAGAFVFTIGLAEVWQDRDTGSVFWRGIPKEIFDADRHVFRLSNVEENAANLRQVVSLIRQVNATAPIVFTLSPVPLLASFRDISCLTADCVSKSVLRVAIDQVMSARLPNVYYWPSFEIVKWVGATLSWPAYGEGGSTRDVNRRLITFIIDAFIDAYYAPADAEVMRSRRAAHPPADAPADDAED
jgi:hypothetical protein